MRVQPQVEVKSFPAEPIKPLASNHPGTFVVGGASSGDIYLWEVSFFFCEPLFFSTVMASPWLKAVADFLVTATP